MRGLLVAILATLTGVALGLCVLLFLLGSSQPKENYGKPVSNPPATYTKSVAIAKAYWRTRNVHNACSKISFMIVDHIPSLFARDSDGQALVGQCKMLLRRGWYVYAIRHPRHLCGLVIHEVGHLNGLPHVKDPFSVMYPIMYFIPNECKHL